MVSFLFFNCSLLKNKNTNKNKEETSLVVNTKENKKEEETSEVVIKEKIDTTITTKSKIVDTSIDLNKDLKENLLLLSNNLVDIRQVYDSIANKLNISVLIKPDTIDIKYDKVTNIKTSKTTISDKTKDSISTSKSKSITKNKEVKSNYTILIFVILIIIGLVSLFLYKKLKINLFIK